MRTSLSLIVLLVLSACNMSAKDEGAKTNKDIVRVFVLAGQSNMQGKGSLKHLDNLIKDDKTATKYRHLSKDGKWVQRDTASIKYLKRHGRFQAGYGSTKQNGDLAYFGPELGFVDVVDKQYDEHILIIKAAWGGRSLAVDFRPPSSGKCPHRRYNKKTKKMEDYSKEQVGKAYRDMISEVHETFNKRDILFPHLKGKAFQLSGFVFFQGFNDVIHGAYKKEYQKNLKNFIQDLRKDMGVKDLPVVVGGLGSGGKVVNPRYRNKHLEFRKAQKNATEDKEIQDAGPSKYVPTHPYVPAFDDPSIKQKSANFDRGYHYYGRATIFYDIGDAFGQAMLTLLKDRPLKSNEETVKKALNKE